MGKGVGEGVKGGAVEGGWQLIWISVGAEFPCR